MNALTHFRYEVSTLSAAVYALANGSSTFSHTGTPSDRPVPEHQVSKVDRPQFFELEIPEFRFFLYGGGKAVITPTSIARAIQAMREEGIDSDWEKYLDSRGPAFFLPKASGYLERRVGEALVRCGELLHSFIGVERKPALEKKVCQPHKSVWRVYGAELGDEHLSTLRAAADEGGTIKFKGQAHTVARCQGGWVTATGEQNTHAGNEVFDLLKVRK